MPEKSRPRPRPPAPGVALGVGIATPCCCMHCANARRAEARPVGDATGAAAFVDEHAAANASTQIASARVLKIPRERKARKRYRVKMRFPCELSSAWVLRGAGPFVAESVARAFARPRRPLANRCCSPRCLTVWQSDMRAEAAKAFHNTHERWVFLLTLHEGDCELHGTYRRARRRARRVSGSTSPCKCDGAGSNWQVEALVRE
jgi:hypothetical protein